MNTIQVISLTLLSVLVANAQFIMPGRCPKPAVQEDFDATRYVGKWYDIQRLPNTFQKGECATATYTLSPGFGFGALNRELLADGTIISVIASAIAEDPSEPAKLQIFYENDAPVPYWVLSTDYDNYALVYSCIELGAMHAAHASILSRQPTLPEETIKELHGTLSSFGVGVDKLLTTNQDTASCSAMNQ
ncbi:apolipoprotein D-like [Perca fluviatilis]|uniref:apolipoprotein D-like n=1 Tax=Perca fluviatilis TaxID=8168 RepID=UPI001964DB6A|nr:apolipoprotein D-like [Perca fluviatilis]XP_039672293.1 apolipoprotein D-like [Perca fluviatilis]